MCKCGRTYLCNCELLVDKQGQDEARHDEEYVPECVLILVIFLLDNFVVSHVVDDGYWACQKYDFHQCVVERDEDVEQI